jgi:hypothetical protein
MGIYSKHILPKLVHSVCGQKPTMRQREKVVPLAQGQVLEIGIGSGLNMPFYDVTRVSHIWGLEPSAEMWAIAQKNAMPGSITWMLSLSSQVQNPFRWRTIAWTRS